VKCGVQLVSQPVERALRAIGGLLGALRAGTLGLRSSGSSSRRTARCPVAAAAQHLTPLMGRGRALEGMLSAADYDAEFVERYGWINRALPAAELGEFVSALAHRIAGFPAAAHAAVKDRANAIALAPAADFRRDQISSRRASENPRRKPASKRRSSAVSRREKRSSTSAASSADAVSLPGSNSRSLRTRR
jgi:hypothetical protein